MGLNLSKFKAKLLNSYYKKAYKKHKIDFISWAKTLSDLYYFEQVKKQTKLFEKKIDIVYSLLCDEKSKQAYQKELTFIFAHQLINNRYFLNFQLGGISPQEFSENYERARRDKSMPQINAPQNTLLYCFVTGYYYRQYEYEISSSKKISVEDGDIVIDCGAAFGATAYWAYTKGAKKIYCFEIDPNNLSIIKNTITDNKFDHITEIIPKALGAASGEIFYNYGNNPLMGNITSSKENDESIPIPVTTIDIFCAQNNVHPTFIKMDIEGAELDALEGARETIHKYKPKLAISIYHKSEHMWEIPLLIHEIEPNYKFYCKKNAPMSEFILHAICE